jgi:hypothetical protein
MTIAKNAASKLFVAMVAAAMVFTLATPAKAATAEELQAQIDALMAQISGLQGGGSATASTAACTFTRPLTIGSEGADVKCLQDAMTPTYFNHAGGSTGYFGAVTQAAVAKWQAANGVSPAAGYFGPISQAKFAAMAPTTPTGDDDDDTTATDDDDDDSTDDGELTGEASLDNVEVADGDDTDDVEEGKEDAQVAEITVEFADGDAMVTRLDIALDATTDGNDEVDPWDVFEEVSLWVDGDEVARMDATDEDEYLDEDLGSLRFAGLDIVAREDEEVVITVAVSVQSSVDGTSDGADWDVAATGLRFEDADEVTSTETTAFDLQAAAASYSADTAEFSIDEAGEGDDLDLETSSDDPDATTFALDEDSNTEEAIFAFELSAEDSDGDVTLNELVVGIQTSATVDALVNDFRIEVDGESYDAESYTGTASGTAVTFDIDGDSVIKADEVAVVVLYADFENMDNDAYEGRTIYATTSSSTVDAEGVENIDVDGGTVTGETHTLRTEGADIAIKSVDEAGKANTDTTNTDDEGVYTIKFDVTAFGQDLWVNKTAASGTAMGTAGVNYLVEDTNGNQVGTPGNGTSTASLSSTASTDGTRFKVDEGETETFTLTIEWDPSVAGFYQGQLYGFNFATTNANPTSQQVATPSEDYQTDLLSIET